MTSGVISPFARAVPQEWSGRRDVVSVGNREVREMLKTIAIGIVVGVLAGGGGALA